MEDLIPQPGQVIHTHLIFLALIDQDVTFNLLVKTKTGLLSKFGNLMNPMLIKNSGGTSTLITGISLKSSDCLDYEHHE